MKVKKGFLRKEETDDVEYHFNQGMKELSRLFRAMLLVVVSIAIFIWLFNMSFGSPDCGRYRHIKELEIKGKVIQKKIEKPNKRYRGTVETLYILNTKGKVKKLQCSGSLIKIYGLADEGDIIKKSKGECSFRLNGQVFYPYNFECDEDDWYISF